jgi:hypothetical protein
MALFSVEGVKQLDEGRRGHWMLFRSLSGSPLHEELKLRIEQRVQQPATRPAGQVIDSSRWGSDILYALRAERPELCEMCDSEELGFYFGMVLWNHLATSQRQYTFTPKSGGLDAPGGTLYFERTHK